MKVFQFKLQFFEHYIYFKILVGFNFHFHVFIFFLIHISKHVTKTSVHLNNSINDHLVNHQTPTFMANVLPTPLSIFSSCSLFSSIQLSHSFNYLVMLKIISSSLSLKMIKWLSENDMINYCCDIYCWKIGMCRFVDEESWIVFDIVRLLNT